MNAMARRTPRRRRPSSLRRSPAARPDRADGDCTNPFGEGVLNRFWAWRSGMETFSKAANQCHFVPFTENDS